MIPKHEVDLLYFSNYNHLRFTMGSIETRVYRSSSRNTARAAELHDLRDDCYSFRLAPIPP